MKRNILFLAILLLTAVQGFAQIEEEIAQSKKEKIQKGRSYLLEQLLAYDFDKVREAKDYLLALEDDNYAAFYPAELWRVMLWTGEYEALTSSIQAFDSIQFASFYKKIKPASDDFSVQLFRRTLSEKRMLREKLDKANLEPEDATLLALFIDWNAQANDEVKQDEWNERADAFLATYPGTEYEWFLRHFVRRVYEKSGWGWGMNCGLGTGMFTGTLSDHMAAQMSGCLSIEASYNALRLGVCAEVMDLKRCIGTYSNDNYKGTVVAFNASAGYNLLPSRRFDLTPFAALGAGHIRSLSIGNDPELAPLSNWRVNSQLGIDFDIRFSGIEEITKQLPFYFRLRYYYDMPYLFDTNPRLTGGVNCFMVCLGFSFTKEKRVY